MNSGPTIKASFELDQHGSPAFVPGDGHNHYHLRLYMENVPEDTYAVTYKLHETYYNPVRESRDRDNKFAEEITSYGDFSVLAKVRSRCDEVMTVSSLLSQALEAGHKSSSSPAIQMALADIRAN